jgi:molybdopterin-binding protein
MRLSTRNQLPGQATNVKLGGVRSEITVDIGGQTIVAVLVKATEVMLGK